MTTIKEYIQKLTNILNRTKVRGEPDVTTEEVEAITDMQATEYADIEGVPLEPGIMLRNNVEIREDNRPTPRYGAYDLTMAQTMRQITDDEDLEKKPTKKTRRIVAGSNNYTRFGDFDKKRRKT